METSYNWKNSITEGPCCNCAEGDHEWTFKPNGGIIEIKLHFGNVVIHSITFKSIDEKGNIETSNKFGGGDSGDYEHVISLNWPKEYLTKLSGICFMTLSGSPGIRSLCFETNVKKLGPFATFGQVAGISFEFPEKDGVIVGFHGRFGKHVSTIGVYRNIMPSYIPPSPLPHKENSYDRVISITVGPCCNRAEVDQEWSFKPNGWITEIILRCGAAVIHSITFKSIDEKGNIETSNKFGGDAGRYEHVISLNWPKEYLTKLSGMCLTTFSGSPGIGSLCFETNLKKYGPFSYAGDTPFEFFEKDGVIVGFHGRFGKYVRTIGVFIKRPAEFFSPSSQLQPKEQSYNFDNSTKISYWGSESKFLDENEWNYRPDGGIVEITICYSDNEVIHALSFKNVDKNGNVECSRKFGGNGGKKEEVIKLDWPSEYLTSVSWTCETFNSHYAIQSLCFKTNKNKYGPFGPTTGKFGKFSRDGAVIVGFHGYHGIYVEGLGYYVMNSTDLFGPLRSGQVVTAKVDGTILMIMDMPRPLGPWGGIAGKPWDDGRFAFIKQIDVHVYNGIVHAIQNQYCTVNGATIKSKRHGGGGVDCIVHRIKLDVLGEYISGVMGFYGPIDENAGYDVVRSLSFYSNKGKYGPFGKEIGIFFSSPIYNGKVVGFHGKSGDYLEAIGVHMELI